MPCRCAAGVLRSKSAMLGSIASTLTSTLTSAMTSTPALPLRSKSAMLSGKALLHVLQDGEEPLVLLLATLGADVNVRDDNGDTPLSCACAHGAWLAGCDLLGCRYRSGLVFGTRCWHAELRVRAWCAAHSL